MAFRITQLAKTAEGVSSIPQLAEIQLKAWLTVPLYRLLYPGPPSTYPTVIRISSERHEKSLLDDPTCHFLVASVAADSDSDSVTETGQQQQWKPVSFIKYNVFPTAEAARNRLDASPRRWNASNSTTTNSSSTSTSTSTSGSSGDNDNDNDNDNNSTSTSTSTTQAINQALATTFWNAIVATRQRHSSTVGAHVSIDILATLPEYHGRGAGRQLLERVLAEADSLGLASVLEASQEGLRLYRSVGFVEEEDENHIWMDRGRWEGGGDKGVDWRGGDGKRKKKTKEAEAEAEDEGWHCQVVMLREARAGNGKILSK